LTCDFSYTEPVGEVTAFTYDDSTRTLVLTGVDLPDGTVNNIESVYFALTHCTVDLTTATNETIECTLDEDPTCGEHSPILTSNLGIIPNHENVTAETITCTLTSLFPSTSLNLLGGDNLTFSGSMLPKELKTSTVSIKFNDVHETECIP
jgi:hypothetical protein